MRTSDTWNTRKRTRTRAQTRARDESKFVPKKIETFDTGGESTNENKIKNRNKKTEDKKNNKTKGGEEDVAASKLE